MKNPGETPRDESRRSPWSFKKKLSGIFFGEIPLRTFGEIPLGTPEEILADIFGGSTKGCTGRLSRKSSAEIFSGTLGEIIETNSWKSHQKVKQKYQEHFQQAFISRNMICQHSHRDSNRLTHDSRKQSFLSHVHSSVQYGTIMR